MSASETYGARVRLAREFRGMTGAELATALDVTRQYVAAIEAGKGRPSATFASALEAVLMFPRNFFTRSLPSHLGDPKVHFRRPSDTRRLVQHQVIAGGTFVNEVVQWVEAQPRIRLPEVRVPRIDAQLPEAIESAASTVRMAWGLGTEAPVANVTRALERAGVVVSHFKGVPESVSAASWGGARPLILRSTGKASGSRARFDLLHECGHMVLHTAEGSGTKRLEMEADRFASAFLMPAGQFRKEFPNGPRYLDWSKLIDLKGRWGVSLAAIVRRAWDLGLIDAVRYRSANIYLRTNGWHRGEPAETEVEQPETIQLAFSAIGYDRVASGISGLGIPEGVAVDLMAHIGALKERLIAAAVVPFPRSTTDQTA